MPDLQSNSHPRFIFHGMPLPALLLVIAAIVLAAPSALAGDHQDEAPPNIVLLVLDTLRADHLGCYGSTRGLTPFIDQLAGQGIRFERVISQSSWTKTSMASVFTARNPASHGILVRSDRMAGSATMLAERLQARGYHCLGIQTNPWLTEEYGFHQGFDEYHYLEPKAAGDKPAPAYVIASRVVRFTARRLARTPQRPLFLYVHFMDPHAPYAPPGPYRLEKTSSEHERYEAEIRFLDDQLRTLWKRLAEAGLDRNTLHVLVSDHGEEFGEHGGTGHGQTLFNEVLHVPLIFHGDVLGPHLDGKPSRTVKQVVRLIDVAPTLIEATGEGPLAGSMEGVSLLPMLDSWWPRDRTAYSQLGLNFNPQQLDTYFESYAMTTRKDKFIINAGDGTEAHFRLTEDPEEQVNLSEQLSRAARKIRKRLLAYIESAVIHRPTAETIDSETEQDNLDQLRALGYITDGE